MKINLHTIRAIICMACVAAACGAAMDEAAPTDSSAYPQPGEGYVTDIANLLTPEEETMLDGWLYDCEKENGFELAVVTIHSIKDYPNTENSSIEAFATALFKNFGIGNLPKNDGVLLLVAVTDHEVRIELGAHYEQSRYAEAVGIMQNVILPQFRNGRYDRGIMDGVQSILLTFAGWDVISGQAVPLPQIRTPVQSTTRAPVPVRNVPPGYVQTINLDAKPAGFGAVGLITGLLVLGIPLIVILVIVSVLKNRGTVSDYTGGNMGLQNNSMIGQNDSTGLQNNVGIVPDGGYGRGFLSGLFLGGIGRQGLHNGGIMFGGRSSHNHGTHFGGTSSHNHGIGHGGTSSHSHSTGLSGRHSAGNFGGGFGGGFSGGHIGGGHHSSFGGGFSRGGGATGKW